MTSLVAKLDNADILKKVFRAVADTIEEPVILEVDEDGFSLQAMDGSHVCLIDLKLHAEAFTEFSCEKKLTLGLTMKKAMDAMQCSAPGDSCEISATGSGKSGSQPEDVTYEFSNQYTHSRFVQKTVYPEHNPLDIPDQEYSCKLSLPANEFHRICKDLAVIDNAMSISFKRDQVAFTAGDEGNQGTIILKENFEFEDDKAVKISSKETLSQNFAVRYLNLFSRFSLSKQVTLHLGLENPAQLEYDLGDFGWVRFYLSPKLDS